ncbi:non-ribosomal peptide synthetase [Xanthomonas sp. 3307]|uniref:non-ribosomal peptide synthetase n=1 Tax=Xanthomonas sp. 3307 TaxID=3035316 RepID=UPI0017DBE749|nr:non-ribosomal peptide synthetase [Xanthomonas sp. 3307]MBB5940459.1 N-(5-amino-5-carboxypentanoyl)-L-cysteinyl-D-valine synthase [Xanthomonas sp. 3307]
MKSLRQPSGATSRISGNATPLPQQQGAYYDMSNSLLLSGVADWRQRIDAARNDRCDLDILLKDTWRHKIVVRDDGRDFGSAHTVSAVIEHAGYASLMDFIAGNPDTSIAAMALVSLHRVLEAYGNGAQTVVGYIRSSRDASGDAPQRLQPSIIDHRLQSSLSCLQATQEIERDLRQDDAFVLADALLGQGCFDAVVLDAADRLPSSATALPLALLVHDDRADRRLQLRMSYAPDLFEDQTMRGVLDIVVEVLHQIVARPHGTMIDLELISEDQKQQLQQWNATDGDFPEASRLDELFEQAAGASPERCAVVCGQDRLSYSELNGRCNRMAQWLLREGVKPGEIVGLYLDKSYRIVVATLALWKAGAAYTPFDPSYPPERIQFTMQDTGSRRILTHRHYFDRLREMLSEASLDVELVDIEQALQDDNVAATNPNLGLGSDQVAYVTYTSGTTGVPKGVAKLHRSVVNSITDLSERYRMRHAGIEHVALFAALVFEPFMRQTLIALINSHTLVVVPDDVRLDPLRFPRFVADHQISYLNGTRSVLQHFDLSHCSSLKRLLLVGEELTPSGLRTLREKFQGRIVNEYAFTETAFVTAIKEYPPGDATRNDRSIGRPLRNVKCYILSQNMKQVPIGAIGELYIGGAGVASGYLNRPELSAERFLANPFQTEQERLAGRNARIYKTGDLAKFLPDGQIEFMGRSDFQLKLNGVRVEPGEIEARALEFPGVRQCVVVARGDSIETGNWRLIGYYVADTDQPVSEADLLAFLESRLIRVMVPARMVRMDVLPVNVNGKVDRHALPDVGLHALPTSLLDQDSAALAEEGVVGVLKAEWGEVLGICAGEIGEDDDFFRQGGQSISCLQLIMRIWQRIRIAVSVEDVYRLKTFGQLSHHLTLKLAQEAEAPVVPRSEDGGDGSDGSDGVTMLATGLQQGMLYQWMKSAATNDAYVMQSLHHYHRAIDADAMRQAWSLAQRKYPSLSLRFEWREEALQRIERNDRSLAWRYIDLSQMHDRGERDAYLAALQRHDRMEPYELDQGQLFRVYLIKQEEQLYSLLFSCHHIILDGWSLPLLHDTVHRFYIQLRRGESIELQEDTAYVAAQRYLESHRHEHLQYWQEQFERLSDRGDFAGIVNAQHRYKADFGDYDRILEHRTRTLSVDARCVAAIKRWCAQNRVTMHSVLQFAWHKVLFALGGHPITAVGTVVSGRGLPVDGIEDSVGLYINTLPAIVDHAEQAGKTIAAALIDIQETINRMNSRSAVELFMVQTTGSKRRLFETLLVLENYPRLLGEDEATLHHEYLHFEKSYDADKVDYPIAVVAREHGDALEVDLWYAGELFDDDTIDNLLGTLDAVFQQIPHDFERPAQALELISDGDRRRFEAWNRTWTDFPAERTLHAAFEIAAERWPDAIAVVAGERRLSYRELNRRANQLARLLLAHVALRPDDLVGLVVDKSEWMIAAILAVWKTGAAYVPIDPSYPDERIRFVLEDTQAQLVLADVAHAGRLDQLVDDLHCQVLGLQGLPLERHAADNLESPAASTDLAYAIYTSGTTGRPKAVLIEHRGVVNLHASLEQLFGLRKDQGDEAILSFSNYVFDHFVEQMTDALLSGQTLVMLDDAMRSDTSRLYAYMNLHGVTYLSGTPSVLSLYEYGSIPSLKRIDAIGEDFTTPVFDKIRSTFDGLIINGYGPTEISITSHKRLYPRHVPRLDKSIGHPVANTACYVLNPGMQRVPVGGVGELYIGGIGVARGYLNRPELTAERFVSNPFQTAEEMTQGVNARLYKTGDLVRWLPNGELEYLGRNDMQVKIRGQRVELGEIEATLSSYPGIARAIVLAREYADSAAGGASQKYLVAFYLSAGQLQETELLQWMRARLPQAIVPVRIIRIPEIPVTGSGKLDVKRLPPTEFAIGTDTDYAPPANEVERELCRLWSHVIGLAPDRIGSRDDFFGVGGDSLRAIKLAQAITQHFAQNFNVAAVFAHPNIAAQARFLKANAHAIGTDRASPAGLAEASGAMTPASLAQERLLFIDDLVDGTAAYNIPFALAIDLDRPTAQDDVAAALRALLRRHAALRTLLQGTDEGRRIQRILPAEQALLRFELRCSDVSDRNALDTLLVAEAGHVFRLNEELPLRAHLLTVGGMPHRIVASLVFHHSCFDGWSWRIFREELQALLQGTAYDALPPLKATYADFALWQQQQLTEQRMDALFHYWERSLAGWQPLNLPIDHPRPAQFDYLGREIVFDIDVGTSDQLKVLAQTTRTSFFSVLLAAYYLTLKVYSGQHDLIVGTPSANRRHADFDGVVGFFVNLLVLRTSIDGSGRLLDYLRDVGGVVLQAQLHEDLPFEQLVKRLEVAKDTSRHPIVQAVFSLLNRESVETGWSAIHVHVPEDEGRTTAKFDLSVTVSEKADGLGVNFTYAASLFDAASIDGIIATYRHILQEFCRLAPMAESAALSDIRYVGTDLRALPAAPLAVPRPAETLHAAFERIAADMPHDVALVHGDTRLTYADLNARANQLAHVLLNRISLEPDDFVALVLDKTEWSVIAILAAWKAGAAYVPIDPGYPDERIAFMLEDTRARIVVTEAAHEQRVQQLARHHDIPVVNVQTLPLQDATLPNPATTADGGHRAYAIYTSGTTGRPKAVLVRHRNVLSFRDGLARRYFGDAEAGSPRRGVLFLANYVFDFSVEQLVLSILSGNTLIIPESTLVFDDAFYRRMNQERLSYISGTPTHLQLFDLSRFDHLCAVLVAGETFRRHHFEKIRQEYRGPLYNAYGTTETSVYNTIRYFAPDAPYRNDIGQAIPNSALLILDDTLRELPTGGLGEIHLGGDCVGAGYLHRDELTRERFIANPFQSAEDRQQGRNGILYKTGDLARRRHSGELEFFGRNDRQVKINGIRIETGEVEEVAASFPGMTQCAVIARCDDEDGGDRLVCYYVAEPALDEHALSRHLRSKLPGAMMPSSLVRLEHALPLTVNGKLDTGALARLCPEEPGAIYAAPSQRIESRLCRIWSDVLHGRAVGIHDNFFQIGGDSIAALHLTSQIRRKFGHKVSVKHIFDFPTVSAFAEHVLKDPADRLPAQAHAAPAGECPLLPIQAWFFAKELHDRGHWNQYLTIRTPALDTDRLRIALDKLSRHHDAFRLRYRTATIAPTGITQFYAQDSDIPLHAIDLRVSGEETLAWQLAALQGGFDLERGPLCRAAVVHGFADGSARIWISLHHLIVDSVSWEILCRDLEALYHGAELDPPAGDILRWAQALQAYVPAAGEVQHWQQIAQQVTADRPVLRADPSTAAGHRTRFALSDEDTAVLIGRGRRAGEAHTLDLMLAALARALRGITGRTRHFVTMESHGREILHDAPDVQDVLGWFTAMYPLAIVGEDDMGQSLAATRANRDCVPSNGVGYGALRGVYGSDAAPLPEISFNYLGSFADPGTADAGDAHDGTARWRLDPAMCGISTSGSDQHASDCVIDITARCIGTRMVVDVDSRLAAEQARQFSRSLEAALQTFCAYVGKHATQRADPAKPSPARPRTVDFEPYFVINEATAGPTLFVLPPGEGGAESYLNNLAKQLPTLRLVLFNNVHLHSPMQSFEEIAKYYMHHVRQLQPSGAYNFFGWSFGGVVSLEMSLQLLREGEAVSNLLMVDSFFNVEKAVDDLCLPKHANSLDPINHRYRPNQKALATLAETADNIVLFKAVEPIADHRSDEQRKVFEYYASSPFNNLDTLLPPSSFTLQTLGDNSHFSWIHEKATVGKVCSTTASLIQERATI